MKKIKQIFFVSLLAIGIISCAGNGDSVQRTAQGDMENYAGELGTFKGLDAQTELQILQDYHNYRGVSFSSINDVLDLWYISELYGTYNGYIVMDINGKFLSPTVITHSIKVANGFISQSATFETKAWKNGQIYSLEELHNLGKLTLKDMHNIAQLHRMWRP
ncbi:MAG: hypothetical protein LBC80_05610 [Treponema sp.]|jgi:hypothetical protein|nr:hypothetical protein [Treponema sp.]